MGQTGKADTWVKLGRLTDGSNWEGSQMDPTGKSDGWVKLGRLTDGSNWEV